MGCKFDESKTSHKMLKKRLTNTNTLKKRIIILSCFIILIVSCRKDVIYLEDDFKPDISDIKNWYSNNINKTYSNPFHSLEPIWTDPFIHEDNGIIVIELKVRNPDNTLIGNSDTNQAKQENYQGRSSIRVILFKDKLTGSILSGCYMAAVGQSDQDNAENINYKNLKQFNGKVHYINLNGSYSNGYGFSFGKVVSTIKALPVSNILTQGIGGAGKLMNAGSGKLMTLPAGECLGTYVPVTAQSCVGAGGYSSCTTYIKWEYHELECQGYDGGDNGTGGEDYDGSHGGGAQPNPGNITPNKAIPQFYSFDENPAINLEAKFACFDLVPNEGATYSVSMSVDLPVNGSPSDLINSSFEPGHAFITMTKSNGNSFITHSFGFYPDPAFFSVTTGPVGSKIVNNGSHDREAYMIMSGITAADFHMLQIVAKNKANNSYELDNYNCTNYALDVFNSIRDANYQINVDDWIAGSKNFGQTPNGLYNKLAEMQNDGYTNISFGINTAPAGTQGCN
jgi:hypothetical protein